MVTENSLVKERPGCFTESYTITSDDESNSYAPNFGYFYDITSKLSGSKLKMRLLNKCWCILII